MADSWINAYEKSDFSTVSIHDTEKFKMSEAIAREGKEYILICGEITEIGSGKQSKDNQEKSGKIIKPPFLASFKIHREKWEQKQYNKTYEPTPAGLYLISEIEKIGYEKPFSLSCDLSVPPPILELLNTGMIAGQASDPANVAVMKLAYYDLRPLEALTKFKPEDAPKNEGPNTGGKGGYGGKGLQTELQKLQDRLAFLKSCSEPGSDFMVLYATLNESSANPATEAKALLTQYLGELLK